MDFLINIDLDKLPEQIDYRHRILLTGSCFTEHIGSSLEQLKFQVMQNPNGILFGPDSVCKSLISYTKEKVYTEEDLFHLNETWHSWQHHSRFSSTDPGKALNKLNESHQAAHQFLKKAEWVVITLGSSFSYRLTEEAKLASEKIGEGVANCHRAPASWFKKEMLEEKEITGMLNECLETLRSFNPSLRFIFTISPVRHIRDGVIANNRSKARLLEAVHSVVEENEYCYYFPAYELVIDVLRDYRFYDIDLVHPNYAATSFVFEKFTETCVNQDTRTAMEEVQKIVIARKHRPFQPDTNAHRSFLASHFEKAKTLQAVLPYLDFSGEMEYFSKRE